MFAIGAIGGGGGGTTNDKADANGENENAPEDDYALTAPGSNSPTINNERFSEKPMKKRILRKV